MHRVPPKRSLLRRVLDWRLLYLRKTKAIFGLDLDYPIQIKVEKEMYGNLGAAWTVCPRSLSNQSVVYSFGVGVDISFDLALIGRYNLNVFAFDPTPGSIAWLQEQSLPDKFHFFGYGLSDHNGTMAFFPPVNNHHISHSIVPTKQSKSFDVPVKCFAQIINELGHSTIDILKMDIEGSEYQVIADILASGIHIQQILIEFHHRFAGIGLSQTKTAIDYLYQHGYQIFHISPNGEEYSFLYSSSRGPQP